MTNQEPIFLKIKGGWLNPHAILAVETHRDNEAMLTLRVIGYERPITLNEADSAYVAEYLASREWPKTKQQGVVGETVTGDPNQV